MCELDANCRTSISKIAKKLKVGRNVISYRISNLEKSGVIKKYICSLNLGLLGYKINKVYFKVNRDSKYFCDFINLILDDKRIITFLKTTGDFDFALSLATISLTELDDFIINIKNKFEDFVNDYFVSNVVYSKIFKLDKLLLGIKKEIPKIEKYSSDANNLDLNDNAKKLLMILSQNANMSVVDLASKMNLSIDVVKYRLKNLSRNLISSYRIMIDFSKFGYYHYVFMLKMRKTNSEIEKQFLAWCMFKQNVIFVTKRIGYYDFEVNLAIKDIADLNNSMLELKEKFGKYIDTYNIILNEELLKLNYVPF